MFAAVQHQQHPALSKLLAQGLGRQTQCASNPCPYLARLGDGRQVDEPRTVIKVFQQKLRDPQHHGGLTDATRAGHRGQALARDLDEQPAQHFIAADHRAQPHRQIVFFAYERSHRRGKAIAAPGIIEDVPASVPPVTERPTQRRNVYPQVGVFHDTVRPDASYQGLLADIAAGVIDQYLENVQCPPAQAEGFAVSGDQSLLPVEGKRAEAHRRFGIGFDETVHGDSAAKNRRGHGVAIIERVCPGSLHPFQRVRRYLGSPRPENNAGTGCMTDITVPWTDTIGSTELLAILHGGQAEFFAEQGAHVPDAAEPATERHGLEGQVRAFQ